jgi:predicted ATP-grasp superfamily ATP-dependent carboligase
LSAGAWLDTGPPGASLLGEGLAMRDALATDLAVLGDYAVTVAGSEGLPPPPGGLPVVSALPGETPAAFVGRSAAAHDLVWVVAPETGGLLAELQRVVAPPRWLGCSAAAIRLAGSKGATTARLHAAGIATPRAVEAAGSSGRWVVKPDDGAGAQATRVHRGRAGAEADLAARTGQTAVIEPWVDGEALSLSLLCGAGGAVELLSVNRQATRIDAAGWLQIDGLDLNVLGRADRRWPALRATAGRVAAAIDGLCGFVGIDLVWQAERGPVVIEINPRLTSAYIGLSAALGRNLAAAVLDAHREAWRHAWA